MPKSVGPDDSLLNTLALTAFEERGDARSAWRAIAYCIEHGIDFPDWVVRYLATAAARIEDHLVNRDEQHPQRLWEALGLDEENKAKHFDIKRDPEEVYGVIKTWLTDGEVKTVAEGTRRYHKEVIGERVGVTETVRSLYYAGKKIAETRPESLGIFDPEQS